MITRKITKATYDLSDKEKEKQYLDIIDWWNSFNSGIKATDSRGSQRKIYNSLNHHTIEEIKEIIKKYLLMYKDETFFFNYKWTFSNFLNTISSKMREESNLNNTYENYLTKNKPKEIKKPTYFKVEEYDKAIHILMTMNYNDYLMTRHWQLFRGEALKFYNNRCVVCGSTEKLCVHHNNYDNRGRETFNDVIVVCDSCHKKIHGIKKEIKISDIILEDKSPFY